ncbi:MAG: glycosyltransferase [candidate division WOR-3 bacterium]
MNKIAWVVPSLKTGLGKYTKSVIKKLKKFFHLDIFVGESRFKLDDFSGYQTIIYNFSNTRESTSLYLAIRKYPGIAILHDRTYHHFFAYYYLEYLNNQKLYYQILNQLYGEKIAKYAKIKNNSGISIWETEECLKFPMRELIYPYTTAIIVHSKSYEEVIKSEYDGEVTYLPLPFSDISISNNFQNFIDVNQEKIKLFSYGFLSENRMIEEILKLIGEIPELKKRIIYFIAGSIHDAYLNKIKLVISNYKLDKIVKLLGFLSDEELYKYISISDICINLRKYNTEGASWSLLEQMFFGKAVVVFDNEFYSEFPDNVLVKIKKFEDLADKLLEIINNPSITISIGNMAKSYVVANFNPERYCQEFIKFLNNTCVNREKKKLLYNFMKNIVESTSFLSPKIEKRFFYELSNSILEIFYRES